MKGRDARGRSLLARGVPRRRCARPHGIAEGGVASGERSRSGASSRRGSTCDIKQAATDGSRETGVQWFEGFATTRDSGTHR